MSFINTSTFLYEDAVITEPEAPTVEPPLQRFERLTGYRNIPQNIRAAIARGETYYLGVELYLPTQDEIWASPNSAVYCFSDSRFRWQNRIYKDNIKSIPELTKFIGKQFNSFTIEMANVERGYYSGSGIAFRNLIRGFRVAVRIIFPELGDIQSSRLIWWGRVAKVGDLTESTVQIKCSQEIGDFSYELSTQKYGSACNLWFGKGDCLGNQTLEQKSLLYQAALKLFGQGGCNRTFKRCDELMNDEFYQGQNIVVVSGQFYRDVITRVSTWWSFGLLKKNKKTRVPVPFSSNNQSETDGTAIGLAFGRTQVVLHPFTWADTGTEIYALQGASRGPIQGFYNIICRNPNLTILNVAQHLGELGGVGTQQRANYFPASGFNSKLAYLEIAYGGSPPEDEPEETPVTTAVLKAMLVPVRDRFGIFRDEWSYNPVWVTRFLMMNFPFTVVREEWFNENKNQQTADYCFTVVEDDTNADVALLTGSAATSYNAGDFQRFRATGRYDANQFRVQGDNLSSNIYQPVLPPAPTDVTPPVPVSEDMPIIQDVTPVSRDTFDPFYADGFPDVIFGDGLGTGNAGLIAQRTYLQYRYTCNGLITDTAKLSDVLFSLVLPTYKGFFRFNHFGQIEIDCRKPADNTFIRVDSPLASTEIGVASVEKFSEGSGWLLIGVGLASTEIARIKGIRYVNGCANTVVTATAEGSLGVNVSPSFIERNAAPSEIMLDFTGTAQAGERIELKFVEPTGEEFKWDYLIDSDDDTLDTIVHMFKTRLKASPQFRETWTAETYSAFPYRIYIRCQTGYIQIDRTLKANHFIGEELLRVVEVYEDGKDEVNSHGIKDNLKDFKLNDDNTDTYHGVTGTYISAVQDFRPTQIQPRVAWDAAEQERNLKLLELDLRFVDNYRQAAFLIKSAAIQFIDGNLPASATTGILGMFHEEGDVVAIRHQTMQGISYAPFTVESIAYDHGTQGTKLGFRLYLSAMFDERVAKEEKFLESSLNQNPEPTITPDPILRAGGYSSTYTGDGGGDIGQNIKYETQPYEIFPELQKYSPHGRDKM